ncbi:MAG: sensor histidine kinase [Gemmatimonadales bacterium]
MTIDEIHLAAGSFTLTRTADAIVAERRQSLDRTRREMTVALERRRRELERALHDGAQQQLLALRMEILAVDRDPFRDGTMSAVAEAGLVSRVDGVLEDLGRLASGAPPRVLHGANLVDALRELAAISGATTTVHVPPALVVDEASTELCAFVVSEALANAQQHSNATDYAVHVVPIMDGLRVDVVDNGRGGATVVPGRGIAGLRVRAEALGGTLEVFSDSGGTLVRLHLPLPMKPHQPGAQRSENEGGDRVATMLQQQLGYAVDIWFWCGASRGPIPTEDGTWRDAQGGVEGFAISGQVGQAAERVSCAVSASSGVRYPNPECSRCRL